MNIHHIAAVKQPEDGAKGNECMCGWWRHNTIKQFQIKTYLLLVSMVVLWWLPFFVLNIMGEHFFYLFRVI